MSKIAKFGVSILILLLSTSNQIVVQGMGYRSGSGNLLVPACGPPDFPSYAVNSTENVLHSLLREGQCYLICLEEFFKVSSNRYYNCCHITVHSLVNFTFCKHRQLHCLSSFCTYWGVYLLSTPAGKQGANKLEHFIQPGQF